LLFDASPPVAAPAAFPHTVRWICNA